MKNEAIDSQASPAGTGVTDAWGAALQGSHTPYHWTAAYLAFALMVWGFGSFDSRKEPAAAVADRLAA